MKDWTMSNEAAERLLGSAQTVDEIADPPPLEGFWTVDRPASAIEAAQ